MVDFLKVPVSGQVTGYEEAVNVIEVANGNFYGGGRWTNLFEEKFAKFMGVNYAITTNSGSSANLLALSSIELPPKSRILTCAINFPTTVNAIIQRGCIPVFVDANPKTFNAVDVDVNINEVRAMIFAHTLGNPMDLTHYAKYRLPIIEDSCDAIGGEINGQMVGRVGIMATASFYPAHHMTTGEGGMITTDSPRLKMTIESYRDWGKACFCRPGEDNTCGHRFDYDYDHRYTYSRIGYNMKMSEFQSAVGVAQVDKLNGFIQKRRENRDYLRESLSDLPIQIVEATPNSNPSWFGFAFLTDQRHELARYLSDHGVDNRPVMAGNITRQPAYRNIEYEVIGGLDNANVIHECGIWLGVFPGIDEKMREHQVRVVRDFFGK